MGLRFAVAMSVLLFGTAACGGADSQRRASDPTSAASPQSASDAPATGTPDSLEDLSKLPFTLEVEGYTGPSLSLAEYKRRVNAECREVKSYLTENPQPARTDGEAVIARWAAGLLRASSDGYKRISALRPPADREAEVRDGFLAPYFDQLNAAERLYIEVIGGEDNATAQVVVAEAQEAKKKVTVYAAKNDLTDCI